MKKYLLPLLLVSLLFQSCLEKTEEDMAILNQSLSDAVRNNDLSAAKKALRQGADAETTAMYGNSVLHLAIMKGNQEMVELLLEKGADITRDNSDGFRALGQAATKGNVEICKTLLEAGAEINHINNNDINSTALMQAAMVNAVDVLELLLKNGAELDLRDIAGDPAVTFATWQGCYEATVFLVEAGADCTITGSRGGNALDWAIIGDFTEIEEYLRDLGQTPELQHSW